MIILQTLNHMYHPIPIYMYISWVNVKFFRHYITSTHQLQLICTLSWVTVYSQDLVLYHLYPSILIYMYPCWVTVYSQDIISSLSLHFSLYVPPLGQMSVLKTLYHPCHSIPIYTYPSWENVYYPDIISPLPLHSILYVPLLR